VERYSLYEDLQVCYEGFSDEIDVRVPDLSSRGMFINTRQDLPTGAVLRLSFLLPRTKVYISARAEVRHNLPGEGVGVEFVNLEPDQKESIERELSTPICTDRRCEREGFRLRATD